MDQMDYLVIDNIVEFNVEKIARLMILKYNTVWYNRLTIILSTAECDI